MSPTAPTISNEKKIRTLVVCPGRGTYNKEELGYLTRRHASRKTDIEFIDEYREQVNQATVSELDGMQKYAMKTHSLGEHASAIIYACALSDYLSIDQNKYEIVATTGNSMGWYIALAIANAVQKRDSIKLIDTMGSMMTNGLIGGQIIYPYVDENWQEIPHKKAELLATMNEIKKQSGAEFYLSIDLGGYFVFAGNETGMKTFEQTVANIDNRFPMRLFNHGAFHTPMLQEVSDKGFAQLADVEFQKPSVPLIDGQGKIWSALSTDSLSLKQYTLGHQVTQTYDFAKCIEVALKEFAPEKIIVLGPGATLGSSVAQSLIKLNWKNINNKEAFIAQQKTDPIILSMGIEEQTKLCQEPS